MIEWVITFGSLTVVFLVATCVLAVRCVSMYEEIQRIEHANADLRYSVKELKTENERLLHCGREANRITALKLENHLKQQKIDALREKLNKQELLLRQKWEASKGGR